MLLAALDYIHCVKSSGSIFFRFRCIDYGTILLLHCCLPLTYDSSFVDYDKYYCVYPSKMPVYHIIVHYHFREMFKPDFEFSCNVRIVN